MTHKAIGIAAAGLAAAGVTALGLVTTSAPAVAETPTPSTTASSSPSGTASPSASGSASPGTTPTTGSTAKPGRGTGGSADTAVTGEEATKVTAAVKAKYPTLTVTNVRKDPDGSYDVLGTKDGANVFYDVSADLATITENTGGAGRGGKGGSADTAVTGDEATKVTAAVKAKYPTFTASSVRKDPDGSYDVIGTKDGANVFYDVSADLATITENTRSARK